MTTTNSKLTCLSVLFEIGPYIEEMVDFFLLEGIMDKSLVPHLRAASDKPKYILDLITKAQESGLLILADFEWQLLPYERIKINFVTPRIGKIIEYNNV